MRCEYEWQSCSPETRPWLFLLSVTYICRKNGGQGQSGQAIKLFQITPYVTDFQTLNNPGSWQPVGASKN